ncbi:MAG: hypothetical protein QOK43_656 [Acidimicrobiaceae bacterium]|nr:hypothetical protein [Acidimicrobiaceae bacterium]
MRRLSAIVLALLLFAACADGGGSGDGKSDAAASSRTRPVVYVAVGASETVGVGADDPKTQAWTQVFFDTALPKGSTFVNVGISGATVEKALAEELPKAVDRKPDVVTVWLNVNDIIARVPVETYETRLRALVHGLRRGGSTNVLVANTPPLDILPQVRPYAALLGSVVDDMNAAIARVVQDEHAQLVDLHAAGQAAKARGDAATLVGADGFHPSTAGHAAVAAEFARVYSAR